MDRLGTHELTQLLAAWSDGEEQALEKLAPLVHAELYRLAKRYMSRERRTHLQLTNEHGTEYFPSLTPDGKSFVYASKQNGSFDHLE